MPWTAATDDLATLIDRATLTRLADDEVERASLLLAQAARKYIKTGNDVKARRIESVLERLGS